MKRVLALSILCLVIGTGARAEVRYSVSSLETANGYATDINEISNTGWVTGALQVGGEKHVFRANGSDVEDLGTFGGSASEGSAINDNGWIGGSFTMAGVSHPFIYDGSNVVDLATLNSAALHGSTVAINNDGDALAYKLAFVSQPVFHVEQGSYFYDGTSLSERVQWAAFGLNDKGMTTGSDLTSGKAFITNGGVVEYLPTLGGKFGVGTGINEAGLVSGVSTDASGQAYAFLYNGQDVINLGSFAQTLLPLPALYNAMSDARALNNLGDVVGFSRLDGVSETAAFIYDNGIMSNLNDLIDPVSGWNLQTALDINDSGQIVGWGFKDGVRRGFILTPFGASVPEPGSWALMIAGFALVGFCLRRRGVSPVLIG